MALALVLVVAAGFAVWRLTRRSEPVYEGKSISYWINRSGEPYEGGALHRIGGFPRSLDSNAIPYLVRALNRSDNRFSKAYSRLWGKLPARVRCRVPSPINAEQMRYSTAMSLGRLGPVGKAAVPALVHALKADPSEQVRGWSAWSLGQLGSQEPLVAEALTNALSDTSLFVQAQAARALARSGSAVSALGQAP